MAPIPVVDEPPGEEEAEQKYQEKVKAEEEAKKEADKKKVMYYDPNTGQMTTEDPDNPSLSRKRRSGLSLLALRRTRNAPTGTTRRPRSALGLSRWSSKRRQLQRKR